MTLIKNLKGFVWRTNNKLLYPSSHHMQSGPMEVIKFYELDGRIKLKIDTFEDLWTVQRLTFVNDVVKSQSMRRFRASDSDVGELKEVVVAVRVEKTELDRNAQHLRVMGKIVEGRPLDYVRLNSYHTINIGVGDVLELTKSAWPNYLRKVVTEAVSNTRRPRLGIIVMDEEKALPAYLLGYGIEFMDHIYSRVSKRMKPKDFEDAQKKYLRKIVEVSESMDTGTVVVAGPGFMKDNVSKFISESGLSGKLTKRLVFESTSSAERPGVYELIKSGSLSNLLSRERLRSEFQNMEEFLSGLVSGRSHYGVSAVEESIKDYSAKVVLVNDSVLGVPEIQELLGLAETMGLRIEIFSSSDEAGIRLHAFKDVASV